MGLKHDILGAVQSRLARVAIVSNAHAPQDAPARPIRILVYSDDRTVRDSVLVTDDAVRDAQRTLWEELRLIAEPAGATGLAALMAGAYRPAPGERGAAPGCGAHPPPSV